MAFGPAPKDHQVVYTTLHFEQPWTFDNYLKVDGYQAWKKILAEKPDPVTIIDELKNSSLRGRGGKVRRLARAMAMFMLLPDTWRQNKARLAAGRAMLDDFPAIPEYDPIATEELLPL